jgi:hypothetical protein
MDLPPSTSEEIKAADKAMDDERKFLEGLLKERFNFFLVAAPVFLFGAFQAKLDDTQRGWALGLGILVFLLASLSILRTYLLVEEALRLLSDAHPYKVISKKVGWPPRANVMLVGICFVITTLMVVLFITTTLCPE